MQRFNQLAHAALVTAGAALLFALTAAVFVLLPAAQSLVAHSDQAAVNVVKASGVWANASAEQAHQAVLIERDVRALAWRTNRTLEGIDGLVSTSNTQMQHVGPLLDSLKSAADSIPPAIQHVSDTADAATGAIQDARSDGAKTMPDLSRAVLAIADTTTHLNGITGDLQTALHPILNPDPCKTRRCKIARDFGIIKGFGPSAEGAYYILEILKDLFAH